jgi:hypothetical protein
MNQRNRKIPQQKTMSFRFHRYALSAALLTLFSISVLSQGFKVAGKVTEVRTGLPVSLATVYINGTSVGTITDILGNFQLDRVILPCELIISHVSYQVKHIVLMDSTQLTGLHFEMENRVIRLQEATVTHEDLHEEYLGRFKEWFLGKDYQKQQAEILNDSVLLFHILNEDQFTAEATEPLKVNLPATGYLLSVDLAHFELKYREEMGGYHCSILGYYYFEPRRAANSREQRMIARARAEAYYNSSKHFCKSLYHNQLLENGYLLESFCIEKAGNESDPATGPDFVGTYGPDDYGNTRLLLTRIECPDFRVTYHFNSRNRPVDLTYLEWNPSRIKWSGLQFLRDSVYIYPSGRIPENSILFSGSIGEKRIAYMLPEDYIPSMQ